MILSRREVLKLGAGAGAALAVGPSALVGRAPGTQDIITKPIPSSGEHIPVIGIGTRSYNTAAPEAEQTLFRETMATFVEQGGTVIDTAAGYGRGTSEDVLGRIVGSMDWTDHVFWATKVDREEEAEGTQRMERSFDQLGTDQIDLMQVHNLRGTATQLATMREWREGGRIRYIGITTSSNRQYDEVVETIHSEEIDFLQINYSLGARAAAERILPMCGDMGIATMINLPFGRGRLFQAVEGIEVPEWAAGFADSWAQFFLKYVVSHPAVTVAIPGTTKPHHIADNMGAARGELPSSRMRIRMQRFLDAL